MAIHLTGKRVLVIDDDPSTRVLLSKVLEVNGAIMEEASSVKEGIEKIHERAPDVILLDLSMPEQNGYVFLETRRRDPKLRPIPVIVLSGTNHPKLVSHALALGADHFREKPFR